MAGEKTKVGMLTQILLLLQLRLQLQMMGLQRMGLLRLFEYPRWCWTNIVQSLSQSFGYWTAALLPDYHSCQVPLYQALHWRWE